jgi:DNA-binding NtrC family response regulator
MSAFRVYLVDDEESVRQGVTIGLRKQYEVKTFASAEAALPVIQKAPPDLVLLDVGLPGMSGLEALTKIKSLDPGILVIMITAYEDVATVVAAMKQGAYDYVPKPIHLEPLKNTIGNALSSIRLHKEIRDMQARYLNENLPGFIGESDAIQDVMQVVRRAAASPDTSILITGASGTGKEVVARAIHYHSPHFKGPFVALNCAAIPGDLLESELFGYEKGAFSGARVDGKQGLIEAAEGGTLFLDEIGDLSPGGQAKLLRFLEEGEYYRVGSVRKHHVKTRIVSATNQGLKDLIEEGLFRLDLYYRLAVIRVEIPSLKDRRDDILPFARHFLLEFSQKHGKAFHALSPELERFLLAHPWRGNVRELRNLIERGVMMSDGPELATEDIGFPTGRVTSSDPGHRRHDGQNPAPLPDEGFDLQALEEHYLHQAIDRAGGNDRVAARLLGMSYYAFRYRKKKLRTNAE